MRHTLIVLFVAFSVPMQAFAQTCNINPNDYPIAVSDARLNIVTSKILHSVQHITPITATPPNKPTSTFVCVAWGGMSSADIVGKEIRAILNQAASAGTPLWHPDVKFANVAASSHTVEDWDQPSDSGWSNIVSRLAGSGCDVTQVQVMALWLVETTPTGDPANGTFSRSSYDAVVATAFLSLPNLRYLEVSGHPFTGYSIGTAYENKVPEPFVHADNARLASWVNTTTPPVGFRTYWAQGEIPHPDHGFRTSCTDVRNDGHHPSTFGTAGQNDGGGDHKLASLALARWAVDPVWSFLSTGAGVPYVGDPPVSNSAPFSGVLTFDNGVCTVEGESPSGVTVSSVVPVGFCDGI